MKLNKLIALLIVSALSFTTNAQLIKPKQIDTASLFQSINLPVKQLRPDGTAGQVVKINPAGDSVIWSAVDTPDLNTVLSKGRGTTITPIVTTSATIAKNSANYVGSSTLARVNTIYNPTEFGSWSNAVNNLYIKLPAGLIRFRLIGSVVYNASNSRFVNFDIQFYFSGERSAAYFSGTTPDKITGVDVRSKDGSYYVFLKAADWESNVRLEVSKCVIMEAVAANYLTDWGSGSVASLTGYTLVDDISNLFYAANRDWVTSLNYITAAGVPAAETDPGYTQHGLKKSDTNTLVTTPHYVDSVVAAGEIIDTSISSSQTSSTLNSAYPSAPVKTIIIAPNAGEMYIKVTDTVWVKSDVTGI